MCRLLRGSRFGYDLYPTLICMQCKRNLIYYKYRKINRIIRNDINLGCSAYESEAQPSINFQASPRHEVVLEYEAHGMGDLRGLSQAAQRNRCRDLRECFGLHSRDHGCADEARCDRGDADLMPRELLGPG